jgi:excisionase family DNA binding protein
MSEEKDKIYGAERLARFFGVTQKTIWEWCKKGKLPAFKIGKEWKVRISDLNKAINQKIGLHRGDKGAKLF